MKNYEQDGRMKKPDTNTKILIRRQKYLFSLEQQFYNHPTIFDLDMDRILSRQWIYVCHASEIGWEQYITYDILNESIIICREKPSYEYPDGKINSFFNVCRHRGSKICTEKKGSAKNFTCPYHGWNYTLDGKLQSAPFMNNNRNKDESQAFNLDDYNLHKCDLRILEGMVFISLAEASNDTAYWGAIKENITPWIKPYTIIDTKVAHKQKYNVPANWKLVVENFRECYHCKTAHPEYSEINDFVKTAHNCKGDEVDENSNSFFSNLLNGREFTREFQKEYIRKMRDQDRLYGSDSWQIAAQPIQVWAQPINDGIKTMTKNGKPVSKLLGKLKEYDGGETGVILSTFSYLYAFNDYVAILRFTPISVNETEIEITWLVHKDAVDVNKNDLIWLWNITTIQDIQIIKNNQKGINSSKYKPGPYSHVKEISTWNFISWYLWRLSGDEEKLMPSNLYNSKDKDDLMTDLAGTLLG